MATTDRPRLTDPTGEQAQAQAVAARYRCEFVDLREAPSITTSSGPSPWI